MLWKQKEAAPNVARGTAVATAETLCWAHEELSSRGAVVEYCPRISSLATRDPKCELGLRYGKFWVSGLV